MSEITQARHEMIRDYHHANPTACVSEVAEAIGVSRSYVRSVKSQYRLAIPAEVRLSRVDDERILRVMRWRDAGWTWREIASTDGRTAPALFRYLERIETEYAASERRHA